MILLSKIPHKIFFQMHRFNCGKLTVDITLTIEHGPHLSVTFISQVTEGSPLST